MEDLIERLEAINKTLYSKFGSESYTERCLIQDVKTEMQALILPVVVRQSEQLAAFVEWHNENYPENYITNSRIGLYNISQ